MSLLVQDVANDLLAACQDGWQYDTDPLPSGILNRIKRVMSQAEQLMRAERPSAFAVQQAIRLQSAVSITATISGTDSKTVTLTSGTMPNPGCSVLLSGDAGYNRIVSASSSTAGTLERTHAGGNGSGVTGTLWHDCWSPGDGSSFENILGDVWMEGRVLTVLTSFEELRTTGQRQDFGETRAGYWGAVNTFLIGTPRYCWPEPGISGNSAVQSRLRFYPMPDSAQTIHAKIIMRAADVIDGDIEGTTRTVAVPGGLEQSVFMPIVWKLWLNSPWFRPDANQVRQIRDDYDKAMQILARWKPMLGQQNVVVIDPVNR